MAIRKGGVVGCGLMGSGIAQTCAQMGYETIVLEVTRPLLDKGIARIYGAWEVIASKGKLNSRQVEENHSRLHGTLNLRILPTVRASTTAAPYGDLWHVR